MTAKKKPKHPTARNPGAKKRRKKRHHAHGVAGSALPTGMVMVPVSALGTVRNPASATHKRKHHHKRRHHHPHKHNPEPSQHVKNAVASVAFGLAAAAIGMTGGYALDKAGLTSTWAKVAANLGTGVLAGGALGLADRTAGMLLVHNYGTAAIQAALGAGSSASSSSSSQAAAMRRAAATGYPGARGVTGAPRTKALTGPDEMEGVIADNMGELDDVGAYEKLEGIAYDQGSAVDSTGASRKPLEGVIADNMGELDDVGAYEKLEGVIADNMGELDDVGAYETLQGFGDPGDLDGEDDLADLDDVGDPDLF